MKRDRGLWVLLTFIPLGWATWGAFLVAGTKAGVRKWQLYAPAYVAVAVLPWVLDALIDAGSWTSARRSASSPRSPTSA